MIRKAYVDTCLLAAYYSPEGLSDKAEKLLLSIEEPIISFLTEVELFSVISKKIRLKELNKTHGQRIISTYTTHLKEGFYQRIDIISEHYIEAKTLLHSFAHSLNSLDSIHLAIALIENIPLATADKNLAKAAKKTNCDIYLIN